MVETAYLLYLTISIGITIWVARTLSRNGKVFLVQCFGHNAELADSTNHLLVVGFYLVNLGFITLTLSLGAEPTTWPASAPSLTVKVSAFWLGTDQPLSCTMRSMPTATGSGTPSSRNGTTPVSTRAIRM